MKKFSYIVIALAGMTSFASAATMTGEAMMKDEMKKDMMMEKKSMMGGESFGMGARGESVMALQQTLIDSGFLVLPVGVQKGTFGPATKRALMKYQQSMGVKATGYFGPMTRAKWAMKQAAMGDGMKKDMMMKDEMKKDTMMEKKDVMNDTMMKKDDGMMKKETMMKEKGSYEAYSAEKLAWAKNGKVVLFFHAPWCPTCKTADSAIQAALAQIPDGVHLLKTDYDTYTALKAKYGVTYQHTFVQVDASGNLLTKWSGSSSVGEILAKIL